MKSDDIKSVMYLALIAGGAYLAYLAYQALMAAIPKVTTAAAAASSSLADAAQSIFQTNNGVAVPGGTYTVTMADGTVQTVPYGQMPAGEPGGPVSGLNGYRRRIRIKPR